MQIQFIDSQIILVCLSFSTVTLAYTLNPITLKMRTYPHSTKFTQFLTIKFLGKHIMKTDGAKNKNKFIDFLPLAKS